MAVVKIDAGVCGFVTTVIAESEDMQMATLKITSECPNYKPLEEELVEEELYQLP
ncbi:MAG: hypothetical protein M1308_10220 [Actinobacteria bacterium]|nr:hypothetical protein [Actinomycetota bacterium]